MGTLLSNNGLNVEIEKITKEFKELSITEELKKETEKVNEKLRKAEETLKVKKQQKKFRDLKDYEKGQILTFGRKCDSVRNKSIERFITASFTKENTVRTMGDVEKIQTVVRKEINDIEMLHSMCELDENIEASRDPALNLLQMGIDIDERCPSSFKPKSTFSPPVNCDAINVFKKGIIKAVKTLRYVKMSKYDNLQLKHRKAIESLRNNKDIIIKRSDNGGNVVILSRDKYIKEGLRQLQDKNNYLISGREEIMEAKKKVFGKLEEWRDLGLME
ncbi:hypothetical protein NDU88_002804 [Pleurodeles waltl]|uniref:Uncharacterized protein n=1 Tax=Pleurodeles waltl TaxID=8319 RepID=A0AAV7RB10_PLEWA|nr:hypothetical protein NDU88_002804 [Pleurodeles waltl]